MVALEDGTRIDVWPRAIGFDFPDPIHCHQLQLNRGDVLVFRGDLVHAGAASEHCNTRVHCFLEPTRGAFERPKEADGTEVTQFMTDGWPHILPRGVVPDLDMEALVVDMYV